MDTFERLEEQIYTVNEHTFKDIALELFHFQAEHNQVYKDYIRFLGVNPSHVKSLQEIPFIPISFFKTHTLKTGAWHHETVFASSGTTGMQTSKHYIRDLKFYHLHAQRCFEYFFGGINLHHFLALLPSYLERKDSSLISMMEFFIQMSDSTSSGFYLNNVQQLLGDIELLRGQSVKPVLWGVTFALLDIIEQYKPDLSHCLIFETGGMKGRRREMTRDELHDKLTVGFKVDKIYSEYGMTELMSQAYTQGKSNFFCPPSMKVIGRDLSDPMEKGLQNENAGINIIDLANFHSIAFIETEDIGKIGLDGSFEVLGRMDNSDVRGCNLMVQ